MNELTQEELQQLEKRFGKEIKVNLDGEVVPNKSFSLVLNPDNNHRLIVRVTEFEDYVEVFYVSRTKYSEKPPINF